MSKRIFSGILLSFLLTGMLACTFNIQPVKAAAAQVYFSVEPIAVSLLTDINGSINGLETPPTPSPVGQNFTVEIHLRNATSTNVPTGVSGLEVHFYFGNILEYAVPTGFACKLGQAGWVLTGPSLLYGINPGFYDAPGNLVSNPPYAGAVYFEIATASTSGPWNRADGLVATISFQIIKQPQGSLGEPTVTLPLINDYTDIADMSAVSVAHTRVQGTLSIDTTTGISQPVASFSYSPLLPIAGESITFDASSSSPGWNGTQTMLIVSYTWDFGDGNVTPSVRSTIVHGYTYAGSFNVTLTVFDSENMNSSCSNTVIVTMPTSAKFLKINLTSYVTIEEPMVGYPAVVRDDITVSNVFNFTLHNVTVIVEAQPYESAPFEIDLNLCDIPANKSGRTEYSLTNGTSVPIMPDLTLIEAFGYEDMRTPSIISVQVSTARVTIGRSTNISGSITPVLAGVNITVYYTLIAVLNRFDSLVSIQGNWTPLATVATDENGIYSCEWAPSELGSYQLKANWTGDQNTQPTESSNITLNCVRIVTSISISASSSSTMVGFRVTISGTLTDEYGHGLANKAVLLYHGVYGVGTFNLITSVATDALGDYSAMWIPSATGTFTVEATWNGNTTDAGANNVVTLSSLPYLNQYVFSVESNSTVSDFVFDTSKKMLSFSVSGESGTSGYTTVTMAKSLLVDPTKLDVLIDGTTYNYTLTETSDSWVLAFTYEHSSHTVEINLEAALVPEFSNVLILFLFVTLAVAVLVAERRKSAKLNSNRRSLGVQNMRARS
jgi:hypothetical protein